MTESRATGCDEKNENIEKQLKKLCNESTKIFICGGQFWNYSVFDGMMLSDGHLYKGKDMQNARFSLSCKHEEFARKFKQFSGNFKWKEPCLRLIYDKRTGKTYHSWRLNSLTDERFTKEHCRWYPCGKKIVPPDIVLDISTLIWWYLGDGHLNRKKSRPNHRRVSLAVQGFSKEDIKLLCNKLIAMLGNDSIYVESGNIIIAKKSLCKFIKLIGLTSPVECYQYKFEFGPYVDENYWEKSYKNRPLKYINEYRKKNKVRELNYKSKEEITHE